MNRIVNTCFCVCAALLVASSTAASADTGIVIPGIYLSSDSAGSSNILTTDDEIHYQVMIAGSILGLNIGDQITGLAYRLDATGPSSSWPDSDVTWSRYDVIMAQAATTVPTMSNIFSENMLNPVQVRSGSMTIPAGSFASTALSPNVNPFYEMIIFDTPYIYQGGDIVIDIIHSWEGIRKNFDGIQLARVDGKVIRTKRATSADALAGSNTSYEITKMIVTPASVAPLNDACSSAVTVTSPGIWFNNTFANDSTTVDCGSSHHDVWYSYTAPSDAVGAGTVQFRAMADSFFPVLTAYDGSCAGAVLDCVASGQEECQLNVPVLPGQTVLVRLAGSSDHSPSSGTGFLQVAFSPANDLCENAQSIPASGTYPFNVAFATPDITACNNFINSGTSKTLWYRYTAPTNTSNQIELNARAWYTNPDICCGNGPAMAIFDQCNGTAISCVNNAAFTGATTYLSAGDQATYVIGEVSVDPLLAIGSIAVTATPVSVWDEYEDGSGDSSSSPQLGQVINGSGPLDRVVGQKDGNGGQDVDYFKIEVCDSASFFATAVASGDFPGSDSTTQASLTLFDQNGIDTILLEGSGTDTIPGPNLVIGGTLSDGIYYLEVRSTTANPDFRTYRIALSGVCRIAVCTADFNGVNGVTVQDIFDFLTAWLAGNPSADFNHVNGVTVQDIFDFLTAWLAGC